METKVPAVVKKDATTESLFEILKNQSFIRDLYTNTALNSVQKRLDY